MEDFEDDDEEEEKNPPLSSQACISPQHGPPGTSNSFRTEQSSESEPKVETAQELFHHALFNYNMHIVT